MSHEVFATRVADAVVSPYGWAKLPSGKWVTKIPLLDSANVPLAARLDYDELLTVAAQYRARIIAPETVVELNHFGFWLPPHTLPDVEQLDADPARPGERHDQHVARLLLDMASRAWCMRHESHVWSALAQSWDGTLPVANFGKLFVAGAPPGRSRLMGWGKSRSSSTLAPMSAGGGAEWLQPLMVAHNRHQRDYGTLSMLERDTDPALDTEPPPMNFVQARNYRPGRAAAVRLIVLHDMEAPETIRTAENVAAWFAGPSAPMASAHYCVDADSIVQCVRDEDTAYHAPGANSDSIGIELAGYARQTAAEWSDAYSSAMLEHAAVLVADLAAKYALPIEWVGPDELVQGKRGITTHAAVSKAYKRSTHTDPGGGFPLEAFLASVRELRGIAPHVSAEPELDLSTSAGVTAALELLGYHVDGYAPGDPVRGFQRAHGLVVDGIVGPKTRAALRAALQGSV